LPENNLIDKEHLQTTSVRRIRIFRGPGIFHGTLHAMMKPAFVFPAGSPRSGAA
jgi:hypothetical protein